MTVVLLLGALECLCRLIEPHLAAVPSLWPRYGSTDSDFYVSHGLRGYALRPGGSGTYRARTGHERAYRINSMGCPGDEAPADPSGHIELLVLGDSCSFGEGLSLAGTSFVEILGSELKTKFHSQNIVVNASTPGYSTREARAWLGGDLAPLKPRFAVLHLGWNDRWWDKRDPRRSSWAKETEGISALRHRMSRFATFRVGTRAFMPLLQRVHSARTNAKLGPWKCNVPVDEFRVNLDAILTDLAGRGAKVAVIVPPNGARAASDVPEWMVLQRLVPTSEHFASLHAAYSNVIRECARRAGATQIDVADELAATPADRWFDSPGVDPVHYNARTHAILGHRLTEWAGRSVR